MLLILTTNESKAYTINCTKTITAVWNEFQPITTNYYGQILIAGIQDYSAGKYISVVGAGVGTCEMVHKKLGPYQTQ